MMTKFNVGDRVKVVMPTSDHIGKVGEVRCITKGRIYDVYFSGDQRVWIELGDEYCVIYFDQEITLVAPAPVTARVIEGVVTIKYFDNEVDSVRVGEYDPLDEIERGDTVRVTIEVLRKAGDSK
jgi:hypothetical protein